MLMVNCSICFEEITNKNKCTTSCNHLFCLECILIHFQQNNSCPLCRTKLIANEKYNPNRRTQYEGLISRNFRTQQEDNNNNSNIRLISEIFSYNSDIGTMMSGIVNDYDSDDDEIPELELPDLEEPI